MYFPPFRALQSKCSPAFQGSGGLEPLLAGAGISIRAETSGRRESPAMRHPPAALYDPQSRRLRHNDGTGVRPPRWRKYTQRPKALGMCYQGLRAMTEEELRAEIERLKAENESLKKPARGQISLKVSEKGAVSVYGLGRFPVTLYREQWEKLLAASDQIKAFIEQNDRLLKKKESPS